METYHGHVRTPADAIILFEACRLGTLPRVQRRLSEKERQSIKSGSVFVWDEREAGMRRWTDGKSWSASRVSGSFLTYREMEGKRGGGSNFGSNAGRAGRTPESNKGSDSDPEGAGEEGPDGYRYKPDGLMKQSFSITTSAGNHLHLISYYSRQTGVALQPSQDPALRHIRPPKGMYPESSINDQSAIPAVTRTPMGNPMGTPPMHHIHGPGMPSAYARPGGPTFYVAPHMSGWPHPGMGAPNGYMGYPPTSTPTPPQHFTPAPLAYPPNGHLPQLGSLQPQLKPHTPSSDSSNRLPAVQHHRTGSGGAYQNGYAAKPTSVPQSNPPRPSSPTPLSKIDPRLAAPVPLAHGAILPGLVRDAPRSHILTPSPPPRREFSATPTSRDTAITSTSTTNSTGASTIPSIGALVNGAKEYEARSRSASRSPSGQQTTTNGAPQDIPVTKIGFAGEDIRALRVLDRAFRT